MGAACTKEYHVEGDESLDVSRHQVVGGLDLGPPKPPRETAAFREGTTPGIVPQEVTVNDEESEE